MASTIAEKILARGADTDPESVSPGDHLVCDVDVAMTHDATVRVAQTFEDEGIEDVWDPSRIVTIIDHVAPSNDVEDANDKSYMRQFIEEKGIETFYEVGTGISHEVLPENGHIRPGDIVVGTDSHTVTHGAFGAAGTGIGTTDMAYVYTTGHTWFRVPETIKIHATGQFPAATSAKDLLLHIAGTYGTDVARYRAIEYTGPAIESLPLDDRMVLSNMAIELGGKFGFTPVDDTVTDYVDARTDANYEPVRADDNADYARTIEIDVTNLRPQISKPHRVQNVVDVDEVTDIELDQVFIGSCTHGKYDDLRRAADVIKGHSVAKGTRLIVTPASREIYERALEDGIIGTLTEAGSVITNSTCGACIGRSLGVLADGEVCLAAQNRNFQGRMGSNSSEIYLGSPETAAASAVLGRISSAEEVKS